MENKKTQISIRSFNDDDIEAFIGLGMFLQKNGNFADCGFNPAKVVALFTHIRLNPDYFGVAAVTEDDLIVGAFLASMQDYYFSDNRLAMDMAFGLLPGYREESQKILTEMLERYESWAKERGAMEIMVTTSTGMHGDKLLPFVNSLGFETVGFNTKKRID